MVPFTYGFDLSSTNNVALYWGQNSAQLLPQPPLREYCTRESVDILILSFIAVLYGNEKIPILYENTSQCTTIPGAPGGQVQCPELAQEIEFCRSQGKKILVSLGGATGGYEIQSPAEAAAAANQIWDTYLGGGQNGKYQRPFGEVELDGIDLDLESPPGQEGLYWPVFIDTMRSLYQSKVGRNSGSQYLITSSPQCPFPDVILSPALRDKRSWFDILFIQFYNNPCAPTNRESFNFNEWAEWARYSSLNPNVKLFLGALASPDAAPAGGYVPLEDLLDAASDSMEDCEKARVFWKGHSNSTYNPFGGIAFWDASWTSSDYTTAIKNGLTSNWETIKAKSQSFLFFKRNQEPANETKNERNSDRSSSTGIKNLRTFRKLRNKKLYAEAETINFTTSTQTSVMADAHNQSNTNSDTEEIDASLFQEPEDYRPATPPPTFATHTLLDPAESITVRLVGKNPLWGHVLWNASRICTNYIETHAKELVKNKTVLEFGAGAGLPGLICAALGASVVTLSDYPDPDLVQNLEYNKSHSFITQSGEQRIAEGKTALSNSTRIRCLGYIWGKDPEDLLSTSPNGYDLLILSDLLFNHSQHDALLKSVKQTLAKPDGVAVIFFTPHRPWLYDADMDFFKIVKESGDLEVEQVVEKRMEKVMFEADKGDENARRMVYGFRVTWKK
ncbi:hypothetical protein H072_2244 [Dactylellina haptotyla CBS 200.50]|uniref:Protein N-terminal and lysine N-methyltransferase EFM7 n=1 Tax=Dactylellina haptotyla (strain CBS 200.50) TaxID=1284197 RepID=S8C7Q9_DACHA|nr:hypothetical protein H072_2244 [Dactylellina haptotyla CBS 200.50]